MAVERIGQGLRPVQHGTRGGGQVIEGESHTGSLAARNIQVAGLAAAYAEHHRVKFMKKRFGGQVHPHMAAGAENYALGPHEIPRAV